LDGQVKYLNKNNKELIPDKLSNKKFWHLIDRYLMNKGDFVWNSKCKGISSFIAGNTHLDLR